MTFVFIRSASNSSPFPSSHRNTLKCNCMIIFLIHLFERELVRIHLRYEQTTSMVNMKSWKIQLSKISIFKEVLQWLAKTLYCFEYFWYVVVFLWHTITDITDIAIKCMILCCRYRQHVYTDCTCRYYNHSKQASDRKKQYVPVN
jgi:hypothetical protein